MEDTRLLVFERQWLERRAEENPRFGVELMTQILWDLGNRLPRDAHSAGGEPLRGGDARSTSASRT